MAFVIGTAGHVDHGKSTLVHALSGIDPDRLREEKERQLTIDLGFAWFTLPNGEEVGVVDVPGHRDFIENMLAGVAGMDCVILVVAADEGVMPQTREHLAIIDLLEVPRGIVALTKVDRVEETEWLTLVEEDIAALLQGTVLQDAPMVRVSAQTGYGLDTLRSTLVEALSSVEPRSASGMPRLPIDRVFTLSGFGTVVTGTLLGGTVRVGDEIAVEPAGVEGRIRSIQVHQEERDMAPAGSRVALNLSGIAVDDISRGDVVSWRDVYMSTALVDVVYRHLPDATRPLEHNTQVKVFSGAFEVMATVRTIGVDSVQPGEEAWMQLRLEEAKVLSRDDRFILRIPSPGETIGGGRVLDPYPEKRWPRYRAETLTRFDQLSGSSLEELILYTLEKTGPMRVDAIAEAVFSSRADVEQEIKALEQRNMTTRIDSDVWAAVTTWQKLTESLVRRLELFHEQHPLLPGVAREELRSQLGLKGSVFNVLLAELAQAEHIMLEGNRVKRTGFAITFSPRQEQRVAALWDAVQADPTAPPSVKVATDMLGEELFYALHWRGDIVIVENGVFFGRETFEAMKSSVIALINERGGVTVADLRDHFGTSRKYILGLLEYLDAQQVTRRDGDLRTLWEEDLPR